MALRNGQLIWGTLKIGDDTIGLPVADHEDVAGGYHTVALLSDRDAIPAYIREAGMICRVWNDSTPGNNGEYQLVPGTVDGTLTNNGNWVNVLAPTSLTNKLYQAVDGTQQTISINWIPLRGTYGNAPATVTFYQLQGGGAYVPIAISWQIDTYPANNLLIYTNNEIGVIVIM